MTNEKEIDELLAEINELLDGPRPPEEDLSMDFLDTLERILAEHTDTPEDAPPGVADTPEDAPAEEAEEAPEDAPIEENEEAPEDAPIEETEEVPEDAPIEENEEAPEDAPIEENEEAPEDAPEEETEDTPEDAPAEEAEEAPEDAPEEETEEAPEVAPEEEAADTPTEDTADTPADISEEVADNRKNCRRLALSHLALARDYWQAAGEQGELPGLPPQPAEAPPVKEKPPRPKKRRWINEVLFYLVLTLVVLGTFGVKISSGDAPMSVAGYSVFTVLTGSMQNEIPQGSLIVTQKVDPSTLEIGDTITYMANQTTIITHRIVGIMENYQDTGERAFETKGIMNDHPDKLPVPAANVIGKVIYHNYTLGRMATLIGEYWVYIVIFLALFWGLGFALKTFLRRS